MISFEVSVGCMSCGFFLLIMNLCIYCIITFFCYLSPVAILFCSHLLFSCCKSDSQVLFTKIPLSPNYDSFENKSQWSDKGEMPLLSSVDICWVSVVVQLVLENFSLANWSACLVTMSSDQFLAFPNFSKWKRVNAASWRQLSTYKIKK